MFTCKPIRKYRSNKTVVKKLCAFNAACRDEKGISLIKFDAAHILLCSAQNFKQGNTYEYETRQKNEI